QEFAVTSTEDGGIVDRAVLDVGLSLRERAYAETLIRQVRATVGAAMAAMRGCAAPQGRKVMLLLSGGWPFSVQDAIRGVPSRETPGGEEIFRLLTCRASRPPRRTPRPRCPAEASTALPSRRSRDR